MADTTTIYAVDDHYGRGPVSIVAREARITARQAKLVTTHRAFGHRRILQLSDVFRTPEAALDEYRQAHNRELAHLAEEKERLLGLLAASVGAELDPDA